MQPRTLAAPTRTTLQRCRACALPLLSRARTPHHPPLPPPPPQQQQQHPQRAAFHTSPTHHIKPKTNALKLLPRGTDQTLPAYPYAPRHNWYKQAQTGLYGGSKIQFGNNVSRKNEIKTRRTWKPNVHAKAVYSVALDRRLRLKVSARVLRTIDKVGGLDEYVLGGKPRRLKELGREGWRLRWAVLQSSGLRERLEREPRLRGMLEAKDAPAALAQEGLAGKEAAAEEEVEEAEEGFDEREGEVEMDELEADLRRRLDEQRLERVHMMELQRPSLWQRVKTVFGRR